MNTNEQQWEECGLEEATHARTATGKVYKLDRSDMTILMGTFWIGDNLFKDLGITPVRKAEVKPVELSVRLTGMSYDKELGKTYVTVECRGDYRSEIEGKPLVLKEVQP